MPMGFTAPSVLHLSRLYIYIYMVHPSKLCSFISNIEKCNSEEGGHTGLHRCPKLRNDEMMMQNTLIVDLLKTND